MTPSPTDSSFCPKMRILLRMFAARPTSRALVFVIATALMIPAPAAGQSRAPLDRTNVVGREQAHTVQIDRRLPPARRYGRVSELGRFHELSAEFGTNKDLPRRFALQALLALSHFPELAQTRIRFRVRRAVVPLMAVPRFFSLFRRRENRAYTIVISKESIEALNPLLVENLSFNGQIGIIGHEIAHVADYEQRGFWGMIRFGFCYLSRRCRTKIERDTDRSTIDHGLGWQLYAHRRDLAESEFGNGQDEPHAYLSTFELLASMGGSGKYPDLDYLEQGITTTEQ